MTEPAHPADAAAGAVALPSRWHRLRTALTDAGSFRGWLIDANDGIVATASVLQGFAGAGAGDRLLLFAATAATIAGALSTGGAKWAEEAAEREAEQRIVDEESRELALDPVGEIDELAALWEERGLTPETARKVAEELTAHDALGAQLDAEYGIDELMAAAAPIWSGIAAALAFVVGAAIPLLVTWLVPGQIEDTVIVIAVVVSLTVTSVVAAQAGHLSVVKVLARSLFVGVGTMAVSYVAGLALF
ncbi:VIT1/CCC1 transporter family protein [Microbacterium sp. bgisy203]|uniref:VIT1/CCC1 transporter family protein n=1 Tax=Microbacterium sp. bgisy203 TaxID=3413799 RepID=UPI003D758E1A